ncbi:MAG: tautomerase family protein, partial [Candidatus Omnitrophota bacterium]
MPNVTLEGPRIENLDTKRELVKTVTDAAVKAFGLPEKT